MNVLPVIFVESSGRLQNGSIFMRISSQILQNRVLKHGDGNNVWDHFKVIETDVEPGFPCYDGKTTHICIKTWLDSVCRCCIIH